MKDIKTKILGGLVIVLSIVLLGVYIWLSGHTSAPKLRGTMSVSTTASTSIFAVDIYSTQRILATSSKRTAVTVQPMNCTTPLSYTILNLSGGDKVATTSTGNAGYAIIASTTAAFDDSGFGSPVPQGSIRAATNSGTCTLYVTEWFTSF